MALDTSILGMNVEDMKALERAFDKGEPIPVAQTASVSQTQPKRELPVLSPSYAYLPRQLNDEVRSFYDGHGIPDEFLKASNL